MGAAAIFNRPDHEDASGYLANAASGDASGVVVIHAVTGA